MSYRYTRISDAFLEAEEGETIDFGDERVNPADILRAVPKTIKTVKRMPRITLPEQATLRDLGNALNRAKLACIGLKAVPALLTKRNDVSTRWCHLNTLLYRLNSKKLLECPIILLPGTLIRVTEDRLAMAAIHCVAQDGFGIALDLETPLAANHIVPIIP